MEKIAEEYAKITQQKKETPLQKLKQKTPNKTEQNLEQLAELFPNVMTEGKVDFDLLRQMLSEELVEGADERYRLDWVGKKASLLKANSSINKTLRPCVEESVNFESTENLYIEGDNFEVLKLIQESYLNKVKMIYIDPPYNTGKDFVYRDNFTVSKDAYEEELGLRDEEENKLFKNTDSNGRFHSDWLSMMYERLLLSRDLLKEDGVIFISIDDNEVHNLRKICDEVFGESNFLSSIMWKRKKELSSDSKNISVQGEYILVYGKSSNVQLSTEPLSKEYIQKSYKEGTDEFPLGKWRPVPITVSKGLSGGGYNYSIITPTGKVHNRLWAYPENSYKQLLKNNLIYFGKDNSGIPQKVIYAHDSLGQPTTNYWDNTSSNKEGKKEILNLFQENYFDTPKPIKLLLRLMNLVISKDDIILDFFSGSATTAHAVMQLNAEDQGNRKFIMVQLPEKTDNEDYPTIAEIGKERIRRAGNNINEKLEMNSEKLVDVGFRVLKVDSSNMKDVYYHPTELNQSLFSEEEAENNIKNDRDEMDLLFSTMLELGIELSLTITPQTVDGTTLYTVAEGELVACFADNISSEVVEAIKTLAPLQVVLKDGCFANDNDKINAVERLSKLSRVSVL